MPKVTALSIYKSFGNIRYEDAAAMSAKHAFLCHKTYLKRKAMNMTKQEYIHYQINKIQKKKKERMEKLRQECLEENG